MKQSAYVGLLAAASLCVTTGCLKKNDSAAKSISNQLTKEELVDTDMSLPVEPDASGNVPTDPASLLRLNNESRAYCFASTSEAGDATYVTSRYVRGTDVWALIDSSSGGGMESAAATAESAITMAANGGMSTDPSATGGGNTFGNAAFGLTTALALSPSVPLAPLQVIRDLLTTPDSRLEPRADGNLDVVYHDRIAGKASITTFDPAGNRVGASGLLNLDDPLVSKHFKTRTGAGVELARDPVSGNKRMAYVNKVRKDGQELWKVREIEYSAANKPLKSLSSKPTFVKSLDEITKMPELKAKLLEQLEAPILRSSSSPMEARLLKQAEASARGQVRNNLGIAGKKVQHAASWVVEKSGRAVFKAQALAADAAVTGRTVAGKAMNGAKGLWRLCNTNNKARLACAAGATVVGTGAFLASKAFWNSQTSSSPGSKTPDSLSDEESAEMQAEFIGNGAGAMADTGLTGNTGGTGSATAGNTAAAGASGTAAGSGSHFDITMSNEEFQRVKSGLAALGESSTLPPCEH